MSEPGPLLSRLWARNRQRSGSVGLATAAVAAVVAAAMGSGYTASQAFLDDGSAWLTRGKRPVHVNAVTGRPDASLARDLAKGDEEIQVVQGPDGNVYVVNRTTNEVRRIDLARMELDPGTHVAPGGPPEDLVLLAGAGRTYLVHRRDGRVETVDPVRLSIESTVTVPGGIQEAVIDSTGAVWAVSGNGRAVRIRQDRVEDELEVAVPGSRLSLALVGDAPVVADLGAGTVRRIDPATGTAGDPLRLPAGPGRVVLNGAGNPGPWLWAVQADGSLARVDLERRESQVVALGPPGGSFGPPVVNGGLVHVPDYAHHAVVTVDAQAVRVAGTAPVSGTSPRFDVFVKDRYVWANDPTGSTTLVIHGDGRAKTVSKGPSTGGDGLGAEGASAGPSEEVAAPGPPPPAARPRTPLLALPLPPRPLPEPPPPAPPTPPAPAMAAPAAPAAAPAAPPRPAAPSPVAAPAPAPAPAPQPKPAPAPAPQPKPAPTPTPSVRDQLAPGQRLGPGQDRVSADGRFRVVMQGDGNLVLYAPGSRPLWSSRTAGNPGAWAIMQSDGNLVVYRAGQPAVPSAALWASHTAGNPKAWAIVQNDGNFVVYKAGPPTPARALWSTRTCCR